MSTQIEEVRAFWNAQPCGSTLSVAEDRRRYFEEIAEKRYAGEPHIPRVARFEAFAGKDVLEIGCGAGTDGLRFARHGARYTGVDLTPAGVELSREHLAVFDVPGRHRVCNAEALPFPDASFDHVYSFGVIHHSPNTEAIVREIYRVLRPGGTVMVMVYNRTSINYYVEIMGLRRAFRLLLRPAVMPTVLARLTGLPEWKLHGHREIMLRNPHMTHEEWVSANTDGPDCPLAKVYDRAEGLRLFGAFEDVRTGVYHFDRTHWPFIGRRLPEAVISWLGRRWGWHRMIAGRKPRG